MPAESMLFGIAQQQTSDLKRRYDTCLQGPCCNHPSAQEQKEEAEGQCRKAILEGGSIVVAGAYSFKRFLDLDSSNRRNEVFDHAAHGRVKLHSDYHGQHLVFRILGIPDLCTKASSLNGFGRKRSWYLFNFTAKNGTVRQLTTAGTGTVIETEYQ